MVRTRHTENLTAATAVVATAEKGKAAPAEITRLTFTVRFPSLRVHFKVTIPVKER
jgi:hypothetical protein